MTVEKFIDEKIMECLTKMCKDANIQEKYRQALNGADYFRHKKQIEDAAVKEFVDYLKSTQVSKMDYMGSDYIAIEDIELARKEFMDNSKWIEDKF